MNRKFKDKKGFTLIELLFVLAIILILILLATYGYSNHLKKTRLIHIQNDIKVTEGIMTEYLVEHNKFPKDWKSATTNQLQRFANLGRLYDVKGYAYSVNEDVYTEINRDYLNKKMNTKLKGTFYSNSIGKVYYDDLRSTGKPNDDDLFDRDLIEEDIPQDKIKVLNHDFPNGIYIPEETIKGNLEIEGIQAGTYTLSADIIHAKAGLTLTDSNAFTLKAGEIKTIEFEYKVTTEDRVGFYDLNVVVTEDTEELVKYKTMQSIYIAQSEWEYFYENDFYGVDFPKFGELGALNPSKLSYEYKRDETYGFDYSSVKVSIDPNDNVTGQAATILPITYGTHEASIKVPDNDALLNGFFLYGTDKHDANVTYEVDMEILIYEGQWELWTTIFNETHKDSNKGDIIGEDPRIVFQKRTKLAFDPSKDFHNYRIDFYESYVSFTLDGVEVARWNNSFDYGDMHMYVGTFYTHWLTGELSTIPLEMNIEWLRRGYFSK